MTHQRQPPSEATASSLRRAPRPISRDLTDEQRPLLDTMLAAAWTGRAGRADLSGPSTTGSTLRRILHGTKAVARRPGTTPPGARPGSTTERLSRRRREIWPRRVAMNARRIFISLATGTTALAALGADGVRGVARGRAGFSRVRRRPAGLHGEQLRAASRWRRTDDQPGVGVPRGDAGPGRLHFHHQQSVGDRHPGTLRRRASGKLHGAEPLERTHLRDLPRGLRTVDSQE